MSNATEIRGNNILIITSNSIEKNALETQLKEQNTSLKSLPEFSNRVKTGVLNGYPIVILNAERGGFKPNSVGMLLPAVLQNFAPKLVLLTGFSYGCSGRVNLHDVIVTNELLSMTDMEGKDQGIVFRTLPRLVSSTTNEEVIKLINSVKTPFKDAIGTPNSKLQLQHGLIFSGEVFASGAQFSRQLFDSEQDAIAGDMEGHFVASQCVQQEIPWLIVKSPSDFGTGTVGTSNAQAFSASAAAKATICLIQEYVNQNSLTISDELSTFLIDSIQTPYERVHVVPSSQYAHQIRKFVTNLSLSSIYDDEFHDHLFGVLKEHAENAAKHAKADEVAFRADADGLIFEYGGSSFNPFEQYPLLAAAGGGKREFSAFVSKYGSTEGIVNVGWRYTENRNQLVFKFTKLNADLRKNFYCTMSLTTEEMRTYFFAMRNTFSAAPVGINFSQFEACETLWINVEGGAISDSDVMLLDNLLGMVPKTVPHIVVRGWPKRLIPHHKDMIRSGTRIEFL
ncbi:hypothetical protein ACO0LL_30190 [Undibacterium sp. TC4M20W]|uniref:5'-methylthioadenosine/S-adenosylhomocysteine nucleosidase family protein n=1 Tax=Undibacterium sp. TC4M20W TaxID=3413052 RepID=UPI003BF050FD